MKKTLKGVHSNFYDIIVDNKGCAYAILYIYAIKLLFVSI